jgi:hypothetical protein
VYEWKRHFHWDTLSLSYSWDIRKRAALPSSPIFHFLF